MQKSGDFGEVFWDKKGYPRHSRGIRKIGVSVSSTMVLLSVIVDAF